jgi:hypothetical protein
MTLPAAVKAIAPSMVVEGAKGVVARLRQPRIRAEIPLTDTPYTALVDAWRMPGGMYMVCMRGDADQHAFLLCYVDEQVRTLAVKLGFDLSLAVDVWLFEPMPCVIDDVEASNVMRHVALAAANGVLPFEPIRPEERTIWKAAVDSLAAVTTRRPLL